MPNFCNNYVIITGNPERLKVLADAAENSELFKAIKHYEEWSYTEFVETYGTKWELGIDDVDLDGNTLTLMFESAWAPPIDAYNLLLAEDDIENVHATYSEHGMDFCGVYDNGNDIEMCMSELAAKVVDKMPLDEEERIVYDHLEGEIGFLIEWMAEEADEEE